MANSVASPATDGASTRSSPEADGQRKLLVRPRGRFRDSPAALLLLVPVLILFGIAVVFPLIDTIRLSSFDIKGLGKPKFVGMGNYIKLFSDPAFRNTMWTTLVFTVSTTFFSVGLGWALAMLCAFAPRQTLPFRVMIFAAFGISEAVAGYMWIGILRPDSGGLLNAVIGLFSPGFAQPWLGDPRTAIWALVATATWGAVGLPLMLCFAAVQQIPKSLFEAAYLDGASHWQVMRNIMVPLSMSGVRVAVFINLLGMLRAFDIIYILTGGGPVRSTETVGYFMYRESMTQFKLGYGAAATVILLVAVLIVSVPAIIQRTAGAR